MRVHASGLEPDEIADRSWPAVVSEGRPAGLLRQRGLVDRTSGRGRARLRRLVRRSSTRPGGTGASFAFLCLVLDTRQRGGKESIGGRGCENLGAAAEALRRRETSAARRLAAS